MSEQVLPFADALDVVFAHAKALAVPGVVEQVSLRDVVDGIPGEAEGRVLAAPVCAERDQPPFDRATRDGFAVRGLGGPWRILGSVHAGEMWHGGALHEGEAVAIMTGAPVPEGADAVVMIEHVAVADDRAQIPDGRVLSRGENIVPRGAEAQAGDVLLSPGRLLGPAEIALAASCGCASLDVYGVPKVAIIATGDELVELDQQPEAWQIRNSNSYGLAALVRAEHAFGAKLPVARDTLVDLHSRIAQGVPFDLLLLSGGVSMGTHDLVEETLAAFGAEFFFTGALIQPGKPVVFGRIPKQTGAWTYFFGLPGNPVSTQVCFHLFVAPLLRALGGQAEIAPRFVEARLAANVRGGAKVTRFLPAEMVGGWDGVTVRVVPWQGSGDLAANARANCYCVLPAGVETFRAGETVRVLLRG